jgi:hypothetical protein
MSLFLIFIFNITIQGPVGSDDDKTDDSPPRTKVIKTKYGEVQGRIFHLMRRKGSKEESRTSQEFNSKQKANKPTGERNGRGYENSDSSTYLPPVAIYYGIPYATPPVGTNR